MRVLDDAGVLERGNDGKPARLMRIPESDKPVRMYTINAEILFSEGYTGYNGYNADFKRENPVTRLKNGGLQGLQNRVTPESGTGGAEVCNPCNPSENMPGYREAPNKINDVTHVTDVTRKKQPIAKETAFVEGEV